MFPNLLTINNKLLFLVAFVLFLNVPPLVFSIIFVVYFAIYGHQLNVEYKKNENKNEDSDENIPCLLFLLTMSRFFDIIATTNKGFTMKSCKSLNAFQTKLVQICLILAAAASLIHPAMIAVLIIFAAPVFAYKFKQACL